MSLPQIAVAGNSLSPPCLCSVRCAERGTCFVSPSDGESLFFFDVLRTSDDKFVGCHSQATLGEENPYGMSEQKLAAPNNDWGFRR